MINLGQDGLNRLPEATKERISKIINHYRRLQQNHRVTSIILLTYFNEDFESILEKLEEWQTFKEGAFELIDKLYSTLIESLAPSARI